ncbi:MAG: phosphoenolpyruvate carboxykinase (GTP) [Candidatus Omnitrophica bacterium]|nr:phosphoenolpyruvate carboxykinase (GTP) [Candidatus Omnitrophota bacterium]
MNGEIQRYVQELYRQDNVRHPSRQQLRELAETYGQRTNFGNINFSTTVRNRSAPLTVYLGSEAVRQRKLGDKQRRIYENADSTLSRVHIYLPKAPIVCVEKRMGDNAIFTPHCRLYVSTQERDAIRFAYMFDKLLFDGQGENGPNLNILFVPEWPENERQILVYPEQEITYVLGSDYFGEVKKGFLRMGMWDAKQKGMLGIHAASKLITARNNGGLNEYSMLLFGLSATGKTTHSAHQHGLDEDGEGMKYVQDDFVMLRPDFSALGTERGIYLKTDGLNPKTQPLLWNAAISPEAVFENVMVDHRGDVYFQDETLCSNGRGIVQRDDLGEYRSKSINIPPVSELDGSIVLFITRRNTVLPPLMRLNYEQAAAAFMLGESIETSAGDPTRVGESVRTVGTNPFIVGDESEEGNRFYDYLMRNPGGIQCYLMNTGRVGEISEKRDGRKHIIEHGINIDIPDNAALIRGIARGTIRWEREPYFGSEIPVEVEGIDISRFDPRRYYTQKQFEELVAELRRERLEYIEKYPSLRSEISGALKTLKL